MIAYLVLCLLSLAAGRGLIRLFCISPPENSGPFLAPAAACAFWSVILGWGVISGVGVRTLAFAIYPATLALAVYGARDLVRELRRANPLLAVCALAAPALAMAPYFLHGLSSFAGGFFPDRWFYMAYGKFLWDWPGSLQAAWHSPLFDYAANQGLYRFISGALMALFSPLAGTPGDPLAASGPVLAWELFSLGCASLYFVRASGLFTDAPRGAACALLTVVSGFTINAAGVNNYDNILVLAFFPALSGVFASAVFTDRRQALFAGFLAAAPAFFYPESLALLAAACACPLLWRLIEDRDARPRAKLVFVPLVPAVALLAAAPQISVIHARLAGQLSQGLTQGVLRPGEGYFQGLVSLDGFTAAYFGLGLPFERLSGFAAKAGGALGCAMLVLYAAGIFVLARRRMWGLLGALGVFLGGQALMIVALGYDYGAYKLLLPGWWAAVAAMVAGADALAGLTPRPALSSIPRAFRLAAACLLALYVLAAVGQSLRFGRGVSPADVKDYAVIEEARDVAGGETIGVFFREIANIPWAVYYLGDAPAVLFGQPHEYFSSMNLSRTLPSEAGRAEGVSLILTDSGDFPELRPKARLLWSGGRFRLYRVGPPLAFLTDFSSPGGADLIENRVYYYLGQAPAVFSVFSTGQAKARFRALVFRGPASAGRGVRLRLTSGDGFEKTVDIAKDGETLIEIPLKEGANAFNLQALGDPSMTVAPNGATGPALLGLTGVEILAAPEGS